MKEYKNTKSTIKPEPLIIDDCSAWVCENVVEVENDVLIEYEYDMYQYGKDEYIKLMAESNNALRVDLSEAVMELSMLITLGGV